MASATASSVDEQAHLVASVGSLAGGGGGSTDNRGRHRILAELNRLEQELKFLQVSYFPFSLSLSLFLGSYCHLLVSSECCLFPGEILPWKTFPTSFFSLFEVPILRVSKKVLCLAVKSNERNFLSEKEKSYGLYLPRHCFFKLSINQSFTGKFLGLENGFDYILKLRLRVVNLEGL